MKKARKGFPVRYGLFLALLAAAPDLGAKAVSLSFDGLLEMLSIIPPVFLLMGLLDVWIPKETMMKYMGRGAGWKGGLIAFLLGSFFCGPLLRIVSHCGCLSEKGRLPDQCLPFHRRLVHHQGPHDAL